MMLQRICLIRTGTLGDAGALERVIRLCSRTGAALRIVTIIEEPPAGLLRLLASWCDAPEKILADGEASEEVERMVAMAQSRGVRAEGEVLRGSAVLQIIRDVVRHRQDLLVKAAQPSSGVQRVLFGHIDRQLIRKCPCPIWIEKPSSGTSHDRLIAAVDPDPYSESAEEDATRTSLNHAILQFAELLSQVEEAEFKVVHVWPFSMEGSLQSRAGLSVDAIEQAGEAIRRKHDEALGTLVRPMIHSISRVHLIKGNPSEEIARLVASEQAELLVIGTMCRTGIGGLLIGNTAETLLDQVDCSLVALKPHGFITPVSLDP